MNVGVCYCDLTVSPVVFCRFHTLSCAHLEGQEGKLFIDSDYAIFSYLLTNKTKVKNVENIHTH
jgi:hypothetical protein